MAAAAAHLIRSKRETNFKNEGDIEMRDGLLFPAPHMISQNEAEALVASHYDMLYASTLQWSTIYFHQYKQ
jgi:hypothetical protein